MTSNAELNIVLLLVALVLCIWGAINGIRFPQKLLDSNWSKPIFKSATPSSVRIICALFLILSIFFLGMSTWQLSIGEFKWKSHPKKYGFSDLFKFHEK